MKLLRFMSALVLMAAAAVAVILMFPRPDTAKSDNHIKIVAAENFWGDIARQIGGDKVSVTSIISDPSADPHLYESSANNAAAIGSADIVIVNGLGYDSFMDKLLAAAPADKRQVINAAAALNSTGDGNPHIWYGPSRVQLVAAKIEEVLADRDGANAGEYRQNLKAFNTALFDINVATSKIAANHSNEPVAYTERVSELMLENARLRVVTPAGFAAAIEEGNDPSPADTAAMEKLIEQRGIKALIYNPQASSPATLHVRELAQAAGIPVVAMTELMPADQPSFQDWQISQINSLEAALDGR